MGLVRREEPQQSNADDVGWSLRALTERIYGARSALTAKERRLRCKKRRKVYVVSRDGPRPVDVHLAGAGGAARQGIDADIQDARGTAADGEIGRVGRVRGVGDRSAVGDINGGGADVVSDAGRAAVEVHVRDLLGGGGDGADGAACCRATGEGQGARDGAAGIGDGAGQVLGIGDGRRGSR